jgi:hypothetical protein
MFIATTLIDTFPFMLIAAGTFFLMLAFMMFEHNLHRTEHFSGPVFLFIRFCLFVAFCFLVVSFTTLLWSSIAGQ